MASANARIGVARTAFFPILDLTASGGFESTSLGDLFKWSSRTWALGQLAGNALSWNIFDNGRKQSRLDAAHAAYEEAVANYRQQALVAFSDVENGLTSQRLLAEQMLKAEEASRAAARTTDLTRMRYDEGESDYFEVVSAQRDSLAAARNALQIRGQRYMASIALVRALGGGWEEAMAKDIPDPRK
jgi:multidrug efflux system outer membrane protein